MWRRFWFHSRVAATEYAPEVLHAGWVPLLPAEVLVTAMVMTVAVSSGEGVSGQERVTEPGTAMAGITRASPATLDADAGDLLARFYANQSC